MNKKVKKIPAIISSFFLSFILFSCATTVNVKLERPAQLDLNGARTIAVLPFKPYNYYREYETSLGTEILINTFYQIFEINDPDEQFIINSLYSQIEHGLLESPYIKLVSSSSVERALAKGTLNPADVYLTGEVSYYDEDDHCSQEKVLVKAGRGDQLSEYKIVDYWRREVSFCFRYQIVDSTSDKVIASSDYRCNVTSSKYESRKSLPSAYYIIESNIRYAANKILHELQPYMVTKSIKLLSPKTKDKALKEKMKAADDLADNYKLAEASDLFSIIYAETGLIEAGYNAAILQEALGNLSKAEKMMTALYNQNPDSRVAKGLADIQYEIVQAERLKNQKKASDAASGSEDLDSIEDSDEVLDLDF